MNKTAKLETIKLWQDVTKIADYADELLTKLPEEEKWGLESKLRGRALDITSDIAEAYGSIDPRDKKWLFGLARRDLFGIKNLLKVAHKRQYAEVDPEVMVNIDKAIDLVDKEIDLASEDIPKWFKNMNPPPEKSKK